MANIPSYEIKYKDESLAMKLLGLLLFFNKDFGILYTTTIGRTIYFPNRQYTKLHPISAKLVLLHELVHIRDSEKYSRFLFSFLYLCPQILCFAAIPLFLFLKWWMALVIFAFFLFPLPAFFRMHFEKKAYTFSVYALYKFQQKFGMKSDFNKSLFQFAHQFSSSYYYFMWPFGTLQPYFQEALKQFSEGKKPYYESSYYDMIDEMIEKDIKF